jgi:hypothetical protein
VIIPFLSPKSYSKLYPQQSLLSLYSSLSGTLKGIEITIPVLEEEARYLAEHPELVPSSSKSKAYTTKRDISWRSSIVSVGSYLNPYGQSSNDVKGGGQGYRGRNVEGLIKESEGKVPLLLEQLKEVILSECIETEGIFRRSSNVSYTCITPLVANVP